MISTDNWWKKTYSSATNWSCPNVSTTPITAYKLVCWPVCLQLLPLSALQLKGKHCWKNHCRNGGVDTFGPWSLEPLERWLFFFCQEYSFLWFKIKLQLHKGVNLVVYYTLTTFWVTWPRLQMWKCRIFITFAVRKMPQEHSIFVSFLPCAISQKNFLDSNPTFMQICQLQLEFLRNGSMVGLVHVVLAITLVSFTKTLSGDTHLNLVKA